MIIYLHDYRSPWPRYLKFKPHQNATDVEHIVVSKVMSMDQVVEAVIRKAAKPKSIWLLLLLAHGNQGYLELGTGLTKDTCHHFHDLREFMTPGGEGIEIHGCAVASNSPIADYPFLPHNERLKHLKGTAESSRTAGVNMLKALARAGNCIVKGAIDAQWVDRDGKYNGHYVVVKPTGTFEIRSGCPT